VPLENQSSHEANLYKKQFDLISTVSKQKLRLHTVH